MMVMPFSDFCMGEMISSKLCVSMGERMQNNYAHTGTGPVQSIEKSVDKFSGKYTFAPKGGVNHEKHSERNRFWKMHFYKSSQDLLFFLRQI